MATIIFDFDGTIADTFEIASNIIINNAKYLKCKQLTKQEVFELKDLHAKAVLKYLNIAFWRVPLFVRRLRKIANSTVYFLVHGILTSYLGEDNRDEKFVSYLNDNSILPDFVNKLIANKVGNAAKMYNFYNDIHKDKSVCLNLIE